jgi:hypothetical protein
MKEIKINGETFIFLNERLIKKSSSYDLELVETGFNPKTAKQIIGGIDVQLTLPKELESPITRFPFLPLVKIFQDQNGKKRFIAYFD